MFIAEGIFPLLLFLRWLDEMKLWRPVDERTVVDIVDADDSFFCAALACLKSDAHEDAGLALSVSLECSAARARSSALSLCASSKTAVSSSCCSS